MSEKKTGFREDDSWFSKEQLEQLIPADEADQHNLPVPTQIVSNGEYMPLPQTEQQKRVEHRALELATGAAKKLGVSRRDFLASTGGMAACFLAMNEVFGRFLKVSPIEMFEPEAFAANGPPKNLFVLDDQLHIVRSSRRNTGQGLRRWAQGITTQLDEFGNLGTPWNPAVVNVPNVDEAFQLVQVIKDCYFDSQMTVGIMSNNTSAAVPDADTGMNRPPRNPFESEAGEFLSAPQTMGVRDWVNKIAGSTRMLGHGMIFPGIPGTDNLEYMQYEIDELKPDSWKGYTSANSAKYDLDPESLLRRWRLDDEQVAYPMYELITRNRHMLKDHPGFFNINIHKGLSTNALPSQPELGHPADIPKAAADWPELNFLMYHACIRPGFGMRPAYLNVTDTEAGLRPLREGVPDILWSTEFATTCGPFPNVYAELGTTFASCVITFPTVCAHLLGQFMRFMGEDRIVFGSDSPWYGGPQWQIDAMWRFEIPEELRQKYDYPQLTEGAKRKILGLNSARLYKLAANGNINDRSRGIGKGIYRSVPSDYEALIPDDLKTLLEFPGYTADNFSRARKEYLAWGGGKPANTRFGWFRKG